MATSIPPHNLGEVCDAAGHGDRRAGRVDRRTVGNRPRPRFSHRRHHLRPRAAFAAATTRAAARSRSAPGHGSKNTARGAIGSSSPKYPIQQTRDRVEERIAELVNEDRIKGISAIRNESDLKEPVRLILELKRDADPEVVLNQLYQFSPLQDTFSLIFLALVDGKPRMLVVQGAAGGVHPPPRDRDPPPHAVPAGQGPAAQAHGRRPAVGPRQYRRSDPRDPHLGDAGRGQGAADGHRMPGRHDRTGPWASEGFAVFQAERGDRENYTLTAVQADAILE